MRVVIILKGESELFEIIRALHTPCGLAGCLYGRQKQGDQYTDDGNNHQKLHESKSSTVSTQIPPPLYSNA